MSYLAYASGIGYLTSVFAAICGVAVCDRELREACVIFAALCFAAATVLLGLDVVIPR